MKAAGAATGPPLQLASLYLTAHAHPDTGTGQCELDQIVRACGTQPADLPNTLDQLVATGLLKSWHTCQDWEDLFWTLTDEWDTLTGDHQAGHPDRSRR